MKSLIDLITKLKTEKDCHFYLAGIRWKDGIINCPRCKHEKVYVFKNGITYKCQECKLNFTVRTGTFVGSSKLPTIKWLAALWLINHRRGISSVQLAKDIGVTQKTAWFMLHRIRSSFTQEASDKLNGIVEIDETFIGGKSGNKHKHKRTHYRPGKNFHDKITVLGLLQRKGNLKAVIIPNVLMLTLKKAILPRVTEGSTLMGDGYCGYRAVSVAYDVKNVNHGAGYFVNGDIHNNTMESAWAQLKNTIRGSYINLSVKHVQKYIDEFVFRYNTRTLDTPGQIEKIIENMEHRLTYKNLIN